MGIMENMENTTIGLYRSHKGILEEKRETAI